MNSEKMLISKEQYKMTDNRTLIMEHSNDIKDLLSQSYWAKERPLEVIKKAVCVSSDREFYARLQLLYV